MKNNADVKIAVLIATYNGERFVKEQIISIMSQSITPKQIIVTDDHSNDKTYLILSALHKKYKNINISKNKYRYKSAAKNFINLLRNVNLNEYDYIALSDQDDIWKKYKLEEAVKRLENGFDAYSSNVEAFWENGQRQILVKNQPFQKFDHLFESAGPGCTFVLNKKFVLKLQQFLNKSHFRQVDNYHDWLIYAFARSHNFNWYIDSYPSVNYRQHSTNVFGANVGKKAFLSRVNRVLLGEGVDFAFQLMKELKIQDSFIRSLFPMSRFNLLRLAFKAKCCRRRPREQFFFFIACILLAVIFPKKLRDF